jgi:hypothetical protein
LRRKKSFVVPLVELQLLLHKQAQEETLRPDLTCDL